LFAFETLTLFSPVKPPSAASIRVMRVVVDAEIDSHIVVRRSGSTAGVSDFATSIVKLMYHVSVGVLS
jgi:hypothetical protein